MKKLEYKIEIKASPEKVWKALWENENYKKWTQVFAPGSYAETDWQEGSGVHFLNGEGQGMYSKIEKRIEYSNMHFVHLGEIRDFKEVPLDVNSLWHGAKEQYNLIKIESGTKLIATIDILEEYEEMFSNPFNQGLKIVKEISEN